MWFLCETLLETALEINTWCVFSAMSVQCQCKTVHTSKTLEYHSETCTLASRRRFKRQLSFCCAEGETFAKYNVLVPVALCVALKRATFRRLCSKECVFNSMALAVQDIRRAACVWIASATQPIFEEAQCTEGSLLPNSSNLHFLSSNRKRKSGVC